MMQRQRTADVHFWSTLIPYLLHIEEPCTQVAQMAQETAEYRSSAVLLGFAIVLIVLMVILIVSCITVCYFFIKKCDWRRKAVID